MHYLFTGEKHSSKTLPDFTFGNKKTSFTRQGILYIVSSKNIYVFLYTIQC